MFWSIPEQAELYIEVWEDNAIVYHSLSGETHCLNELAVEMLLFLKVAPATLSSLLNQINTVFEVEDNTYLEQRLLLLLGEFENLGFIESSKCEN
jgi:PqqD family protein of HPr-rel-A system